MKNIFANYRHTLFALLPVWGAIAVWLLHLTLGHYLVMQAYAGTSPITALNKAIKNQAIYPLANYILFSDVMILRYLAAVLVIYYIVLMICYRSLSIQLFTKILGALKRYFALIFPTVILCTGVAAVVYTLWAYAEYTPNIPCQDEYETSLDLLINIDKAKSVFDSSKILLHRHSIHITLPGNLANIIDWKLFGVLNFRHLVLFAFIFLLAMTLLLQIQIKGRNKDIHAMTVALLCINCLWYGAAQPVAALQNFPILALIPAGLFLLARSEPIHLFSIRFFLAALILSLATFTAGNGMFGIVASATILSTRKANKALLGWCAWGILVVIIFFHIFNSYGSYKLGVGFKQSFDVLAIYCLTLLGSMVQVIPVYGTPLTPFFGVVVLATIIFLLKKKYHRKNPGIAAWILFMLMTIGVIALGRCGGSLYSGPLASRYAIISCVLVALIYVAFIEEYGTHINRLHAAFLCLIGLLFNVSTLYLFVPAMDERQERLITGALQYVTKGNPDMLATVDPQRADMTIKESAQRHIYNMANALAAEQNRTSNAIDETAEKK